MYVVLTGIGSFGSLTGIALYSYPIVAVGVISVALGYFILADAYRNKDRDDKLLLQFPENIRYFVYTFAIGLLLLLALAFTIKMIVFFM